MRIPGFRLVLSLFAVGCASADVSPPTAPEIVPSLGKSPASPITLVQLPGLGGASEAFSVNDAGQVVGYSADVNAMRYPFAILWQKQGTSWTLTRIGPAGTQAEAINEAGNVVGKAGDYAAAWMNGGPTDTLGRGEAKAINDLNVVVGQQYGASFATAAAWMHGSGWTLTILDPVPGDEPNPSCAALAIPPLSPSSANGISNSGVIVGYAYDNNCVQYAVKWVPKPNPADGWEPAERLAGTASMAQSIAYAIVDNTVVGAAWPCAVLAGCQRKAYRWSLTGEPGITGAIGTLDARANGLNTAGSSAGSYVDSKGMHAVVWSPSGTTYQTLPEISNYNAHWLWDINNPTASRTSRYAVGGATSPRAGHFAMVWTIP